MNMIPIHYVLGLLFNTAKTRVVLIEKQRPEWQKGTFNGVGGKIEEDESPLHAMKREFREEAALWFDDWKFVGLLQSRSAVIYLYKGFIDRLDGVYTMTDERIALVDVNNLPDNIQPWIKSMIPIMLLEDDWYINYEKQYKPDTLGSVQVSKT